MTTFTNSKEVKSASNNNQRQCLPKELQKPISKKFENDGITVVVADFIIKNLQKRKVGKAVGHWVVVKNFPYASICDMKSHIIPKKKNSKQNLPAYWYECINY